MCVCVCVCVCVFVCDVTDADLLCHFLMGSEAMKVHYTVALLLKEPPCKGHYTYAGQFLRSL